MSCRRDALLGRALGPGAHWARARCPAPESVLLGHSVGAATVMIEAGATNKLGAAGTTAFDVYVALSPRGVSTIFPAGAWHAIHRPVLTITGTRDEELGGLPSQAREQPFEDMPPGCKWLGVVDGASHMDLGGRGRSTPTEKLTVRTIGAFPAGVHAHDCRLPPPTRGITLQGK